MKVRGREGLRLPPLTEDSIKVVRAMRAASPPASAMELIEQQQQQKRGRRSRRVQTPPPYFFYYLPFYCLSGFMCKVIQ